MTITSLPFVEHTYFKKGNKQWKNLLKHMSG
jgi:hypothetical protein